MFAKLSLDNHWFCLKVIEKIIILWGFFILFFSERQADNLFPFPDHF